MHDSERLLLVVVLPKAPVCPSLAVAFYNLGVPYAAPVPIVYQALTVASVIVFLIMRNSLRSRGIERREVQRTSPRA